MSPQRPALLMWVLGLDLRSPVLARASSPSSRIRAAAEMQVTFWSQAPGQRLRVEKHSFEDGSWAGKAGGAAEICLQEGQSERRQPPSAEAQEQRFPEVTGTGIAHSESQSKHFPPLMGDPTNPQDTLFLFVFFPCQVSGLTELPPGD